MQEQTIFTEALEKENPVERAAFLDRVCAGDLALRQRIDRLLLRHQQGDSFLESPGPALSATVDQPMCECPGTIIGPYKLLEQIGEGGFGLVFMAEQQHPVRRKVALKILKPGMDTRQVIARFEAERQALALMDHPNIARVLDAGETGSGRPHFVMELVRGVPITDYCDQSRLTTRERLALFTHVCHAVQHAHHKGIIHRDLKPSNVMVTLHDGVPVVKVIDFGVAKALGQQLTDKTLFTGFAQMIGTPMYMSPEQAQLSGLDIDTRSDIYSLGVLLYELLAGVTPFDRERMRTVGYDEMRRIIREEDPPSPSTRLSTLGQTAVTVSAQRQSDPKRLSRLLRGELDWIVMKALEKDRNRRYETANELARDVDRYLNDEPVLACPPSSWYRFRKFTRRHKVGLRITAAAALVLLLAGAGVSWTLRDQAARRRELSGRRAETEQTVSAVLIKTQQLRKQAAEAPSATSQEADAALALWRQAEASLEQAEAALRTGTAGARLQERVQDERRQTGQQRDQAQRRAILLRDLDDARMTRSIWIESHFDFAGADTKYAAAFAAYGLEVKLGRTEELARRIRAEHPAIREALIVALEDWGNTARGAKRLEWAKLLEAIAAAADDDPWRRQYRLAATGKDATALRALSAQARRLSLPPSSLELLASHLVLQGDRDEALALLRWARGGHVTDFWIHFALGRVLYDVKVQSPVILEETIGCYRTALALRPTASAAHVNLGWALQAKNQWDEAIAEYEKAIELDPRSVNAHMNLAGALQAKNQLDEAIAEYRKLIELDPKFALAHANLAYALKAKNQLDEAIAEYRKAIELDPKFAISHMNLGLALRDKNQLDEAIAEYHKAIELDPKSAWAHEALGHALQAKGQLEEAIGEHRKAIELDPKRASAHEKLGSALRAKGKLEEAMGEHRKAIELDPKCASAHNNLGYDLRAKGRLEEAIGEFKKAIELDPKHAWAHDALGNALKDKNQLDDAIAEYRKTIDLDPKSPGVHWNLGLALMAKNQMDPAVAEFRNAIELDPKSAGVRNSLGVALMRKNQLDEAIAEYRKAIELDPNLALAHCNLGTTLKAKNQLDEAIAEYRKSIELDPKDAWAHGALGSALRAKNQLDAAIAEIRKAIELDPKLANAHNELGSALMAKGQLDAAAAEFRKAIELDAKLANAHNNLGAALMAKGQLDAAVAEIRKAIELDPSRAPIHDNLGRALYDKNQMDEAIAEYRRAIDLDPKFATAHDNLGKALQAKNQWDEAIGEHRKAIELDPKLANAHNNLGKALAAKDHLDEAIAEFRKAIDIDPNVAFVHNNLGIVLQEAKNQLDEASAEYKKAIELDPKLASAHYNLGTALQAKSQLDEAIAQYKKATELDPKYAPAHYNLGWALQAKNQWDEAIVEYKKVIDLQADCYAEAHCCLADILKSHGQLSASLDFYKRGHAAGSKRKDWRLPSAQWVADAERLVRLEAKLADILAGKAAATDDGERLGLAEVCYLKRQHVGAARLYADAFTADPKLADDLKAGHRYNAACSAALAAAGQAADADKLDDQAHRRLRQQTLAWLRADLEQWAKGLEAGKPEDRQVMRDTLEHWQRDTDLASVREADALRKLTAQEQEAWRKLWADVADLLKKTGNATG